MTTARDLKRPEEAIDAEAGQWFARRKDAVWSLDDERKFQAWLAEPRHAEAYAAMGETVALIESMPELAALAPPPGRKRPKRIILPSALAATFALLVLGGFLAFEAMREEPSEPLAVVVADTTVQTLPDGSSITPGEGAEFDIQFSQAERRIRLAGGDAEFDVTRDPARPFVVEMGDTLVRVVGTKFTIHRGEDVITVAVEEGAVEVRRPPEEAGARRIEPMRLGAGERAEVRVPPAVMMDQRSVPAFSPPLAASPDALTDGRFVFEDARLADVIADIHRHYPAGIRIADADIADIRITTTFQADAIDQFLSIVPAIAPARVDRDADGGAAIRRRD